MVEDYRYLHSAYAQSKSPNSSSGQSLENPPLVYLVEDDESLGKNIQLYLERKLKCKVVYFSSPKQLLQYLENIDDLVGHPAFCLVTDVSFSDSRMDGLLMIDLLNEKSLSFSSVVMTGFASIESAISATKKGVFHYLTKPFDLESLANVVVEAFSTQLSYSVEQLRADQVAGKEIQVKKMCRLELPNEQDIFYGMIGRSKKMQDVFEKVRKVALSCSTVLINGPSGTGKELIANAIHRLSKRGERTMVSVNCGAIPSELLESELFGHMKGAFTGAITDRMGRFEYADKGTIFLDEIGDMPLLLQVKMLRVLQSKRIERVGGHDPIKIDTRIVAATHRNLEEEVSKGNFREDLFYRLNVIPIKIPSLSERRDDIPLLLAHFLDRFSSADGRNNIEFQKPVMDALMSYDWPGNVRELENLIERLIILKGGSAIKLSDLPAKFLSNIGKSSESEENLIELPNDGIDLKQYLAQVEHDLITQALERTKGNKNQASKLLKLNRTTLIEKMKKRGMIELLNSTGLD